MVAIKEKYKGKKMAGGTYIKDAWDEVYLSGRSGETPMEYDYGMTITTIRNWRNIPMGEKDWRG